MKWLRTLNFQIYKSKIKNKKPIAVDVLFKAYPMFQSHADLARQYLPLKAQV
jgi:hypothetical protein